MAFEVLYKFIDRVAEEYRAEEERGKHGSQYLYTLVHFHDIICADKKLNRFKSYCLRKIYELSPGFGEGYFGIKKEKVL